MLSIRADIHSGSSCLYIAESPGKGRGVFAGKTVEAGEVFESCPVLLFNDGEDARHIDATPLADYYYRWDEGINAIVLGYGSLYNHSYTPNAYYRRNYETQLLEFIALRKIEPGEEIVVNYNGNPNSLDPVWFPCID